MLKKTILPFFIFAICIACNTNRKKEVPKVLDNKKADIQISLKRSEIDLVNGLYTEAVNSDDELKNFEAGIKELQEGKDDSLSAFGTFDGQNKTYYQTAATYADKISDSILKASVKKLITQSIAQYDTATYNHDSLLKQIITKEATLQDLQNALKIVYTLPLIEKYQQDNLPSPASIEGFSIKQAEVIKRADTLIKK